MYCKHLCYLPRLDHTQQRADDVVHSGQHAGTCACVGNAQPVKPITQPTSHRARGRCTLNISTVLERGGRRVEDIED